MEKEGRDLRLKQAKRLQDAGEEHQGARKKSCLQSQGSQTPDWAAELVTCMRTITLEVLLVLLPLKH